MECPHGDAQCIDNPARCRLVNRAQHYKLYDRNAFLCKITFDWGLVTKELSRMTVRLKDIANDLNLSKMTISKVLRGQTDISAATKARVLQRMKELNYRPNIPARSLRTGNTLTIGLVIPSLTSFFFADVARGLIQTVRTAGYGVLISSAEEDPEIERHEIELQLSRQVDALIVASVQESAGVFRCPGPTEGAVDSGRSQGAIVCR